MTIDALMKELRADYTFTDNPWSALFIFPDGSMIEGEFYYGSRCLDHGCLKSYMDNKPWSVIHKETGVIRLTPESRYALIGSEQTLTPVQVQLVQALGFEYEVYC